MSDSSIIELIKESVQAEGHTPGTPAFEHRVDQMKVVRCREMRGNFACSLCDYYDNCELIKRVMRYSKGIDA
jgi:hypothetical protein